MAAAARPVRPAAHGDGMTRRPDRLVIAALVAITALYLILFGYFIGATALRVPVFTIVLRKVTNLRIATR